MAPPRSNSSSDSSSDSSRDSWKTEPVAIVGTSCRFPGGASSPSKLWHILRSPPDLRKEIPPSKFNQHSFHHPESVRHGTSNVAHSYVLEEDVGEFDHAFFNLNPKEAESMDPQQRLLLETVYEGIEEAGYAMSDLRGSATGVYVGQMTDDYYDMLNKDVQCAPQYTATGSSRAIIANRVSYFFDWRGPSVNVDTACSSSLVALHQAVQALRGGEVDLAVAAGVNLILGPEKYIYESQLSMLSPTGRSRMWDADADGYARGEGFAAVVVKRLSQALADNDHIECIIRETGVNQDGRSEGLTVPSSEAQAALIQSTYSKCGLDWRKTEDRCQYFEAHGTGTQAGDPKEARAIRCAFFPEKSGPSGESDPERDAGKDLDVLYVGSVKTVIGHLEGAAGLAGLLKASLAVQHGQIPPNLHFNRLNPKIEPFYDCLEVPTRLQAWPELPKGVPRRASVNSFGFGGTNAHAIIESWPPADDACGREDACEDAKDQQPQQHFGPFALSAGSDEGLMAAMSNLAQALKTNPGINLRDLAWTLQLRREHFPVRAAIAAVDRDQLIERLAAASKDANALSVQSAKAARVSDKYPVRILGVFTGQGAQWPRMGAELYTQSARFRQSIDELQASLDELPDAPSWSLRAELLAPEETSRVRAAEIAQPICTAVQVALVHLLQVVGVSFHAVVGHSSGEIAAAYAAGYLSSRDAIRIAYYRGVHSHLASSPTGQPGKMMAIGLSFQDAQAFCQRPPFHGRVAVAASNARSSVTVSGDADAILEAKEVLDAEGVFARALQVDKAYHSHHMQPCSGAYLNSLRACDIKVLRTHVNRDNDDCVWYSSVHGSAGSYTNEPGSFADQYWVDNLVQPVMFSQALDRAVQESQRLDLVLEVGPHPALRGPATDLIKSLAGVAVPYSGVLKRGENDLAAFSEALGFVWRHVHVQVDGAGQAQAMPDFEAFARACASDAASSFRPQVCKSLPTFPWNHSKPLLWESRTSKLWRGRKEPEHDLLGLPTVSGNRQEVHWRKIMRVKEMDWLRGHKFQNQVLFPAAGYVSMAVEAASYLVPESDQQQPNTKIKVIELNDMKIHRAITLSEQSSMGTEVTFVIRARQQDAATTTAEYSCYSIEADAGADEQSHCNFTGSATIIMTSAREAETLQPSRREAPPLPLTDVNLDQFYASVSGIGLDYSGDFLADSIRRRLGLATVSMSQRDRTHLIVDPAVLDTSFHGVFSAFSYPNDGRMWTAYLPTSIRRVRVTTQQPQQPQQPQKHFSADCILREASDKIICADVDLYSAAANTYTLQCQLEGLTCTSFTTQSPDQDRKLFSHTVWRKDIACGIENNKIIKASHDDSRLYEVLERTSYFFLRKLREDISTPEIEDMAWHAKACLGWVFDRLLPSIEEGQHPRVKPEWAVDREEDIQAWRDEFGRDEISLRAVHAIGQAYAAIVRGDVPPLQILLEDNVLNRLYKDCIGGQTANTQVGELVGQLAHRYPQMNILEIGAGTGGTTTTALQCLRSNFASYTYTDISPGFFEKAASNFSRHAHKMIFKTLDIERDPVEQGYEPHSFDVIMAANVLHATKHLDVTIAHCHKLLKPGGRMILLEITSEALWIQTIFSALPGWWLGQEEGRINHPTVSIDEWDGILRRQGFSGVDVQCRDLEDEDRYTFSVFTTQALDGHGRVEALRSPLLMEPSQPLAPKVDHIALIGPGPGPGAAGTELTTLVSEIKNLLSPFANTITVAQGLHDPVLAARDGDGADMDAPAAALPLGTTVLSLVDLHEATFRTMDAAKFQTLKSIFNNAKTILWATRGCRADDPYANIMVGLGRSVMQELAHLNLQFVDVDPAQTEKEKDKEKPAVLLSNMLLRMLLLDTDEYDDPEWQHVVWSGETETLIQGNGGDTYIPRIVPEEASNQRINLGRRTVQGQVNVSQQAVTLRRESPSGVCWLEQQTKSKSKASSSTAADLSQDVAVRVQACSLFPVVTKEGRHHFVCVGKAVESGEMVLALTPTNSSIISLASDDIIPLGQSPGGTPSASSPSSQQSSLRAALVRIICESLVKPLANIKGTVWLHVADASVAEIASEVTSAHGLELLWTSSTSVRVPARGKGGRGDTTPRVLHPFITERELRSLLPSHVRCLLTLGEEPIAGFYQRLASGLDDDAAEVRHLTGQTNQHGHLAVSLSLEEVRDVLRDDADAAKSPVPVPVAADESSATLSATPVDNLPTNRATAPHVSDPLELVDWACVDRVAAVVKPLDTGNMFSHDKTYFLVGLTGELGLGLCNWMIDNGARHLALSSRKPDIDPRFLGHWKSKGAHVRVFALDVADEKMLHDVHRQIVETMPPVGGVMNGAMVLRDRPFSAMTLEDFDAVLGPKVRGSEYLDNIFHSDPLEFFILFSSLSRVIGNPGQSNYAAANMFMASLAAQRRARGVSASVVDIAMLVGFGWMWRNAGELLEAQMKAAAYMSISEPEFHTIMAEAMEAGRVEFADPEIHTGLALSNTASWKRFPRFSHFVPSENQGGGGLSATAGMGAEPDKTLRQLISEATSDEDVLTAIEAAFSRKLRLVLQLADTGAPMDPKTALLSLGMDSLVAVELRSWFLKELAVDVPTLRILSDATIADISVEVKSKLSIIVSDTPGKQEREKESPPASARPSNAPRITIECDETSTASRSDTSSDHQANHDDRWLDSPSPSSPNSTASPSVFGSASNTGPKNTARQQSPVAEESPAAAATAAAAPTPPARDSYERTGPMSHSQEALHFLHEYLVDKSSQNVLFRGRYPHRLNMAQFEAALQHVAQRHEALRSAYFVDPSTQQAVQGVHVRTDGSGIQVIRKQIDAEADVDAEVQQLREHVFDISHGKLMVVAVLSVSPSLHHIVFVHHHIVMDAQATIVFLTELTMAYAGQPLSSSSPPQAIDVCAKRRAECMSDKMADKLAYWMRVHGSSSSSSSSSPIPLLRFAKTQSRQPLYDYDLQTFDIKLDADLCALIRTKSSQLRITPFHFYVASFHALLARCLGNTTDDMNIGIVDSNRGGGPDAADDAQAVGCFLNLLPLRVGRIQDDETFDKVAQRTRDTVLAGLSNAGVPFQLLLDELKVPRHNTHHPLFQVIVNYRLGIPSSSPLGDGQLEWTGAMAAKNSYDLAVEVSDTPRGACVLSLTTQRYMYSAADTEMLTKWYMHTLKSFAQDSSVRVSTCSLADAQEMRKATALGHGPTVNIEWEGTLVDQIARVATEFPDAIAIKDDDGNQVSYSDMIKRTDQICRGLQASNIQPGSRVAVLLPPDVNAICTPLAVLRRGLVWVPLDMRNPWQRLAAIVADCKPRYLVHSEATQDLAEELAAAEGETLDAAEPLRLEELLAPHAPTAASSTSDPTPNLSKRDGDAVLLYTSGSTGVPKGVRLTHIGLLNQIYVLADVAGERQVVLQQTSHGFDMALDQIFNALARGGTLIVVGQQGRGDPKHLARLMLSEGVTYTCIVPSEYHLMLQYGFDHLKQCRQWRFAHAGGEKVTHHLRRAFRHLALPDLKLFNAYGPTETYLGCARGLVPYQTDEDIMTDSDGIRILPNYGLTIVDEQLNPAPSGFPGEICISSPYSISPGYVNRPEETESRFIDSSKLNRGGVALLPSGLPVYRTGDLGRLSAEDGTLTVLGRMGGQDSQVKIRGQRVELDEIAATIVRCSKDIISNAAVSWRPEDEMLVALVVLGRDASEESEESESIEWVRHGLRGELPLPPYMRPSVWVPVAGIPTNSNGKTDRRAIDAYPIPAAELQGSKQSNHNTENSTASLSEPERQVAKIWEQVLGEKMALDMANANTDFFGLGGNSRNLIELRSLLESQFAPARIQLPELFQHSTLGGMAALFASSDGDGDDEEENGSQGQAAARVDWNKEIEDACEEALRPLCQEGTNSLTQNGDTAPTNPNSLVVVLTGATGFLGSSIAQRLVDDDRVCEVHCIAIRGGGGGGGAANGQTRRVPVESDKIIEYPGDLESPRLGLSEADFARLSKRADMIIHNGAQVSFLKTYQSLRQANVSSTVELGRMALVRAIPLHFVSTGAVALVGSSSSSNNNDDDDDDDANVNVHATPLSTQSASDRIPAPESQSGYQDSKWVAEQVLEALSTQHGLPVVIHRPASIVGAGAPKLDLMAAILNTSRALGKVPALEGKVKGPLDLVAVQDVSSQLVDIALETTKTKVKMTAKFVHHCNNRKLAPSQLKAYLEEEEQKQEDRDGLKTTYSLVGVDEWLDAAAQAGMEPLLHDFLSVSFAGGNKIRMPSLT
ncbi:beta-ketoacyl synthase domain-containing protein [Sodiomyces alkalinus F11]|uniref:Beta-ketoacyl synthase domain-containing protein n=1 Tax=Sodiomyces alkalinus (strain CBS 110278 / VKM F-3762 / F11) TaxID=1314773 RepID=A0A3N2PPK0_SODAK|nr:beta-ketoacyl synthase domain-containing protein [Sodiomyces alkalinus F11]ROT36433.1 beta-ketoacyl synthase domain-containing protein [Sodiomyces alkalinus F11]